LQPGDYVKGKRVKEDEPRKLYKLYQALLLEALVSEIPVASVIKTYFPCSHLSEEAAVSRHLKDVKDLQVHIVVMFLVLWLSCAWMLRPDPAVHAESFLVRDESFGTLRSSF
jgi:hypothetical protein